MVTASINYFKSNEDLKTLTDKCVYISLHTADIAMTSKGNLFLKLKCKNKNKAKIIQNLVFYLIEEGWKIKKTCSIFVY
jgi:hypothetical protein